jgi:hypothetical protein
VFGNFIESQCRDPLEVGIGFLERKNKSRDASAVCNIFGKSFIMSGYIVRYLAMQARAHAADSLTPGSNSSMQTTSDYRAPELMMDLERALECLAIDRRTKQAAFL